MGKTKIGIIDHDYAYCAALGNYLMSFHGEFDVTVYDDQDYNAALKSSPQVLLASEEIWQNLIQKDKKGILIVKLMAENLDMTCQDPEEVPNQLYKYASARDIAMDLRFIGTRIKGGRTNRRKETESKVIGVFSGGTGTGKTVIAITTARDLASRFNKRVLYLNFESLESASCFFREAGNSKRTLSDFLYYLFNDKSQNNMPSIDCFLFKDFFGLYIFHPSQGANELKTLTIDEMKILMDHLCNKEDFDYILVDFSSDMGDLNQWMLHRCYKIIAVSDPSLLAQSKNNVVMKILMERDSMITKDTFMIVKNKLTADYIDSEGFNLAYDPNSFSEVSGYMEISINNMFGRGIRKITDQLHDQYANKERLKEESYGTRKQFAKRND